MTPASSPKFQPILEGISVREAAIKLQDWFKVESGKDPPSEKKDQATNEDPSETPQAPENKPLTFRLKNLDPGHPYLESRGLSGKAIAYFGLGYCPRGIMAGRIAIPIHNECGDLVAYAGRTVEEASEENPKYKLPPNFKKNLVVFNLHQVEGDHLILVEGFFDVFALWEAGICNAAALMGSSMSEEQEALILERVGKQGRVTLMFDGDEAGQTCTKEVTTRLIQKIHLRMIMLKEGQQPDNLTTMEIQDLLG